MRIASIILSSVPYVAIMPFLAMLFASTGPEGFGYLFLILYVCAGLTVLSGVAVLLAFLKRPASKLDIPARVLSIISVCVFALPGAFGALFFLMSLDSPPLSY